MESFFTLPQEKRESHESSPEASLLVGAGPEDCQVA